MQWTMNANLAQVVKHSKSGIMKNLKKYYLKPIHSSENKTPNPLTLDTRSGKGGESKCVIYGMNKFQ